MNAVRKILYFTDDERARLRPQGFHQLDCRQIVVYGFFIGAVGNVANIVKV
ncbi:MAG: hypothetical protein ACJAWL_001613 [Motiliproteus sp.]|jgi:hypothetical protein